MESILIIDDDAALCSMLQDYFKLQQMHLAMSHHGLQGLEAARDGRFDMVLLDIMLPGIDGFEVLRRLRAVSSVGVLMLTSRGEADDRIAGLEGGADDYLPKPFNPRELVARIRAVLRRRKAPRLHAVGGRPHRPAPVHGFALDREARCAQYRGRSLPLTETEFVLLDALLESPGVVVPREKLSDRISQRPFHPLNRSLDMLVSRLRKKLDVEDNPGAAIRTIRASGYVFTVPPRHSARVLTGQTAAAASP